MKKKEKLIFIITFGRQNGNLKFMQARRIFFLLLLLVAVLFGSCNADKSRAGAFCRVVIISTNDMHAQLQHFPKFASFVKQVRAENPHVILVDAGDRFSGNVYVDNAEEKGKPMFDIMGRMGYRVANFGNHEFDYGQSVLGTRKGESAFPVICANIQAEGSELGQPAGYAYIEEAGIKFCFLGLIETNARTRIPATNPEHLEGITFRYYKDVALGKKNLKDSCDVFVGLTHIGYTADSLLALEMPEFDLIVGGHSHTLLEGSHLINGVLVTQAASNLKYAGMTCLDFKGKELVNKTYQSIRLDTFPEDTEIKAVVEQYTDRPEFQENIGRTSSGMKYKENVACMVTDAMCRAAGCDFAFCNSGGVRYNSIPAGDITRETIFRIEPFANYIVMQELTLAEMKHLILNRFNGVKNPADRRIDLFVSQGRYTILKDKAGKGIDVVFVDKNGKKLKDEERKYKVGLSNYINSTYDFNGKGKGKNTGISIVDAMIGFVKEKGDVNYNERRTFIVKK